MKKNIRRAIIMNNNKVVDYPIYGGYDRKTVNNPTGNNIEYEYYCIPTSIISSDNATFLFSMYPGYGSIVDKRGNKIGIIEGNPAIIASILFMIDEIVLKFPKVAFSMWGAISGSTSINATFYSYSEFLKGISVVSDDANLVEVAAKILEYAISEKEYNTKLDEIKSFL